jgi:tetratricopeptide (TPR) repeat protein
VSVEEGTVWVWTRGAEVPVVLHAGQSTAVVEPSPQREAVTERTPPPSNIEKPIEHPRSVSLTPAPREATAEEVSAPSRLESARAWLPTAPQRALELAQDLLDHQPEPPVEAGALAVLADAQRRTRQLARAADTYLRVADHRSGRAYAEEALYQRALLLNELGDRRAALEALDRAKRAFPTGALLPERLALTLRLLIDAGEIAKAATTIEEMPTDVGPSLELLDRRIEVARGLLGTDATRARRLLDVPEIRRAPSPQRERAAAILATGARPDP